MYYIKTEGKLRHVRKAVAHVWLGEDTACRMASTGGLDNMTYTICDTTRGKSICKNCLNNIVPGEATQLTLW